MDTTTATSSCSYCLGGKAEGPSPLRPVTCMVCNGTGRTPARLCAVCDEPLLDDQPKRWVLGQAQHGEHGATWRVVEAYQVQQPCLVRDVPGTAGVAEVTRVHRDADEVTMVLRLGGEVRVPAWRQVDTASLR